MLYKVMLYSGANKDSKQIKLMGAFLHLTKLYKEDQFENLLKAANDYISAFNIIAVQTNWESVEEYTYFSKETLGNFIVLYKYKAEAELMMHQNWPMEDKKRVLLEYADIRSKLGAQIQFMEYLDSKEDLLIGVGCTK